MSRATSDRAHRSCRSSQIFQHRSALVFAGRMIDTERKRMSRLERRAILSMRQDFGLAFRPLALECRRRHQVLGKQGASHFEVLPIPTGVDPVKRTTSTPSDVVKAAPSARAPCTTCAAPGKSVKASWNKRSISTPTKAADEEDLTMTALPAVSAMTAGAMAS